MLFQFQVNQPELFYKLQYAVMALSSFSSYDKFAGRCSGRASLSTKASEETSVNVFKPESIEFPIPYKQPPADFIKDYFADDNATRMKFLHGTTTLAFLYEPKTDKDKGGVVVCTDSRATGGVYISSKTVMKIIPISDNLCATMAGGAADCQFWMRMLSKQARLYKLQNKEDLSVAAASKLLANMLYNYKGMGLSIGTTVVGYDNRGPSIYYVDSSGHRVKGKMFSVGSGSLNAYAILDTHYKQKMTDDEAVELGRSAIMHATFRDVGSGGNCRLYTITPEGGKWGQSMDVSDLTYKLFEKLDRKVGKIGDID